MDPVITITGRGVPLARADVDTDQIIPASWLKRIERTGFGEGLFSAWRADPDFVLNKPEYGGAKVLVAGPNFGSGSSREHAAWALQDYGFEVVIAPSFGDIFASNSAQIGLLTVALPEDVTRALMGAAELTVDLETLAITDPAGREIRFEYEPSLSVTFGSRTRVFACP